MQKYRYSLFSDVDQNLLLFDHPISWQKKKATNQSNNLLKLTHSFNQRDITDMKVLLLKGSLPGSCLAHLMMTTNSLSAKSHKTVFCLRIPSGCIGSGIANTFSGSADRSASKTRVVSGGKQKKKNQNK